MEEWKQLEIDKIKWNYEISTHGRVRSLNYKNTGQTKILKQQDTGTGYLQVHLSNNGKTKYFYVHRLVALTFIPNDNPQEKKEVNHIDENKSNNHVDNLEWVTPKQNIHHGTCIKRRSESKKKKKG